MRIIIFIIFFMHFFVEFIIAQAYNNPESIVYDKINHRYLISNKGGNTILQLDSLGNLTNFVTTGLNAPKGLLIVGDTLISVNNTSIKGYKLKDATSLFSVSISGSVFMNDVTIDDKGYLYISDSYKQFVYRLKLSDGTYTTLISSGINPNGLLYDKEKESLLICSNGNNAKIQSFSLNNLILTTLVTTKLSDLDGLAKDNCGNIFVSSWGTNSVYIFDSVFSNPPTRISTGHNGPADIFINENKQILAIPNFNSNTINLVDLNLQCQVNLNYLSPLNKSLNNNESVKICWDSVIGISNYELQYTTDSTFYTSVITIKTTKTDTLINGLLSNTKYFWRVRTIDSVHKSIFNKVWCFTTKENFSGIFDSKSIINFKIYPNPTKNHIFIEEPKFLPTNTYYSIIDINQRIVIQGILDSRIIDLTGYPSGIYFLKIQIDNEIIIRKICLTN